MNSSVGGAAVDLEPFEFFLKEHPLYGSSYERLAASSRVLGTSAQMVFELYPSELGIVVDDILSFTNQAYAIDCVQTYLARVQRLTELQQVFDANPGRDNLGNGTHVDADSYGIALLLSIVFTNHRFEIMRALRTFCDQLSKAQTGSLVSVGCGTGYELKLAAERLDGWNITAYDTDPEMGAQAHQLLEFFNLSEKIAFQSYFPLDAPSDQTRAKFDAIILCEVLEHLSNPAQALSTLAECLTNDGQMFVTMAINLAQEDHIYLYTDPEVCREQIRQSGLDIAEEWLAPQTVFFPPRDRERGFKKGNYVAIVRKQKQQTCFAIST